jgi:hypothetical protein
MNTKKVAEREDPLDQLIKAADPEILGKLIKELALTRPEIRRECFEFLKDHVTLTPDEKSVSSAEAMFALWMELEPDLAELDEYGGGDYGVEEQWDRFFTNCRISSEKRAFRVNRAKHFWMRCWHILKVEMPEWTMRYTMLPMRAAMIRMTFGI